jgi:uncharacterized protein YbcI
MLVTSCSKPDIRPKIACQNDTRSGRLSRSAMSAPSASTTALPTPAESRAAEAAASPLLRISNETVQLYKRAFGRGPTKVRTLFADPDTVVIVLEDALTAGERTLLDVGAEEQLREFRQVIQEALEPAVRSLIERTLGRGTRAFIPGIDPAQATAAHVITLEPAAPSESPDGSASRNGTMR